jgi:hypothetical protein
MARAIASSESGSSSSPLAAASRSASSGGAPEQREREAGREGVAVGLATIDPEEELRRLEHRAEHEIDRGPRLRHGRRDLHQAIDLRARERPSKRAPPHPLDELADALGRRRIAAGERRAMRGVFDRERGRPLGHRLVRARVRLGDRLHRRVVVEAGDRGIRRRKERGLRREIEADDRLDRAQVLDRREAAEPSSARLAARRRRSIGTGR